MNTKTLVIVESPAKCKKIQEYLGKGFKVIASCGHFTKLNDLKQIDFTNYTIKYKIDKQKVLQQLKCEIANASDVIIATDDDREGEAIGWTICKFCNLDIKTTKKIVFQEITKSALKNALLYPRTINMNTVFSQQTRQILDICVGFKISPILWKYVQNKLSAGRCQTPALKLIYENEEKIRNTTCERIYKLHGLFSSKLIPFNSMNNISTEHINDILKEIASQDEWVVSNVKHKERLIERAPSILITSTLQQKAYNLFKMTPKQTMKNAQQLYENGLITYMRTDSSCYSSDFIDKLRTFIEKKYGEKYVSPNISKLKYSNSKTKTQDAHEGIRVCDLTIPQSTLDNPSANKLYKFIYDHCIQCGMSDYVYDEKVYGAHPVINNTIIPEFIHVDKKTVFEGWKILENETSTKKQSNSYRNVLDLYYTSRTTFHYNKITAEEHIPQPVTHYNEASLVKSLEKLNIGRPSTFSSIVSSIIDRGYVNKCNIDGISVKVKDYTIRQDKQICCEVKDKTFNQEKSKLKITELGERVCRFCYDNFDELFNYSFTNEMETSLDAISQSSINHKDVLDAYIDKINRLTDTIKTFYKSNPDKILKTKAITSIHCGEYKGHPIFIKKGKYGFYVNYEETKKMTLKDFNGFSIQDKLNIDTNNLNQDELSCLVSYIKQNENDKKNNCIVAINDEYSLRESKFGFYVYYKTKKMKQPQFLKLSKTEKDIIKENIDAGLTQKIIEMLSKKYKLNI